MLQNWEYKFLKGERKPEVEYNQEAGFEVINKYENELTWIEDGKLVDDPIDITAFSNKLGLQGWELITVVPRSLARSIGTTGTTTEELWVFKRPK